MSLFFTAINGQVALPTSITGLQRWYYASTATTTVETGGRVVTWLDQSGNGRNATAASLSTARPTLTANQIAGQSVLAFDGVANYLDGGTNKDLVNTAGYTFVVVFSRAAYPGTINFYEQVLNLRTDLSTTCVNYVITDNYAAYNHETMVGYGSSTIDMMAANTGTVANTYYYTYSDYNGSGKGSTANYSLLLSRTTETLSIAAATWTPGDVNQYGRYPNAGGSGYFKGNIAEIIIYNKQLSAAEKTTIKFYLQSKYNL